MKQAMGEEEVGARNAAGKHAVHLAGKRWFLKSSPGFLAVFPIFRCRRKPVKFLGNGEALEVVVELSPEAQEGGGGVGKFSQATPPDGGLTALPCCPEDPLLCLL